MKYTPGLSTSLPLAVLLALPLAGCKGDGDDAGNNDEVGDGDTVGDGDGDGDGDEPPAHCEGSDAWVRPSTTNNFALLQGLLSDASEGDVLCLDAGVFEGITDELIISNNGITLRGAGEDATILDFDAQTDGGNGIKVVADGVTFENLQVRNTPGDGIRGDQVNDISFVGVKVLWDDPDLTTHGAYGLYPVGCNNVTIIDSTVIGSRDAGHYVGQSNHIVVRDSLAYQNVAGVEIENSYDAWVFDNVAHDNTAGLLVFDLPGLEQGDGARTRFYNNEIYANNFYNFAIGGVVGQVPSGTGVVILAANDIEVDHNIIDDHKTAGVLIVHYADLLFGVAQDPTFDIHNRGIHIHDNTFTNIGYDPDSLVGDFLAGNDGPHVLWDGMLPDCAAGPATGEEICVHSNTVTDGDFRYFNLDFCGGLANPHSDASEVDCVGVDLGDWPG
jgi:parallel beta-helix repeat protein